MNPVLIVILSLLGAFILFGVIPCLIMSYYLYRILLVRNKKEKWNRECSFPEDEEYVGLYKEALDWREENKHFIKEVKVNSGELTLKGEYFDFGYDKAVIIIPGRTEGCYYCCFFAKPYKESGYNVLTIDNRAHGLSDGKYNTLGFKEGEDLIAWCNMLRDKFGINKVVLHGICVGSASAINAATSPVKPEVLSGIVTEGMYTTFYDSFVAHMIELKHPVYPFSPLVMLHIKLHTGANVYSYGPKSVIDKLNIPALFIHSREDRFSLPDLSEKMYSRCLSDYTVAWFDKGAHSRVRIHGKEKYDKEIKIFLEKI